MSSMFNRRFIYSFGNPTIFDPIDFDEQVFVKHFTIKMIRIEISYSTQT